MKVNLGTKLNKNEIYIRCLALGIFIFSVNSFIVMRSQSLEYFLKVLLIGLSTRYRSAKGFGFNFSPSAPSIPLQVAAGSPFPIGSPGCGVPFCGPQTIILAPSFSIPPIFAPPPFPPPYPFPSAPYFFPQPQPSPKQTLISNLIDALFSKKGKSMPQPPYLPSVPPPPPAPAQYPPQQQRIQVKVIKDLEHSNYKTHNQHQNHWNVEKPYWN